MYDSICSQLDQCQQSVRVMGTIAMAKKVLPLVLLDCPEYFYVDSSHLGFLGGMGMVTLQITYTKHQAEIRAVKQRLNQIRESFLTELSRRKMNNRDTVRFVHNIVIKNTDYAMDHMMRLDTSGDVSTICGVFLHHKAVCLGISLAAKWLLDQAGICSGVIEGCIPDHGSFAAAGTDGMQNNHSWNIVNVNDCWQYMDVTMDLGGCQSDKTWISYDYFLRNEANMRKYVVFENPYITCDVEADSYFVSNKVCFSRADVFRKYLKYCAKSKVKRLYFQMTGELAGWKKDRILLLIREYILCGYRMRNNEALGIFDFKLDW